MLSLPASRVGLFISKRSFTWSQVQLWMGCGAGCGVGCCADEAATTPNARSGRSQTPRLVLRRIPELPFVLNCIDPKRPHRDVACKSPDSLKFFFKARCLWTAPSRVCKSARKNLIKMGENRRRFSDATDRRFSETHLSN